MSRRRLGCLIGAGLLAGGLAACGGDGDKGADEDLDPSELTTTTQAEPEGALPPPGALDLEPIYIDQLADLGLRLTDRGGLIDRSGGGYEPSPTGRHLALYVEPVEERTNAEYVEGIRDVGVIFADVFERWPGLESYDVCQEPFDAEVSNGEEPLPVTQIELTKPQAEAIDWEAMSVTDVVRASTTEPPGLALRVSAALARDPDYIAIIDAIDAMTAGDDGSADPAEPGDYLVR